MRTILSLLLVFSVGCSSSDQPSPTAARETESSSERDRSWIPFELFRNRYIYLEGSVNGHDTDMVLDTGAGITIIDTALAERIGVRVEGGVNVKGVGGTVKSRLARGLTITTGRVRINGVTAAIVDMSLATRMLGRPMQLVLGTEIFMKTVVDIDYPNRRVAVRRRRGYVYRGPGKQVDLKPLGNGLHAVRVSIEGGEPGWYQVDTGSGDTIDVCPPFAQKHGLLERRTLKSKGLGGGIGGFLEETDATLRSVTLGGYELRDVPASFPDENDGLLAGDQFDGNLGAGVLSRFRVICDFGSGRMYLEPGPDWQRRSFPRNHLGLFTMPRAGAVEVLFVAPGSPAARAGWRKGMRVTAVDGESPSAPALHRMVLDRLRKPPGTVVTVRDGAGRDHVMELARYY